MVLPALTPLTIPEEFTVATPKLEDTQGFVVAAEADPVSEELPFAQTKAFPEIVGFGFTVKVIVD